MKQHDPEDCPWCRRLKISRGIVPNIYRSCIGIGTVIDGLGMVDDTNRETLAALAADA